MLRVFLLAPLILGITNPGIAQVAGRLAGSVADKTGAAVPDARVSLYFAGGSQPLALLTSGQEGRFVFGALAPNLYDLTIERTGFLKYTLRNVKVDPGKETALAEIRLELATVTETIDVGSGLETVQTSNAEISTTVTNEQIRRLPLLNRSLINLMLTQPGVSNGRGPVVINGMRASYGNVSFEGVNVQDNFIRSTALTYQPNLFLIDQVGEFTVATSNTSAASPGGGSQIIISSPTGTNQLHGAAYWYNRNSAAAASNWFDNRNGIPKAFLNQNQAGGRIGGTIRRDRLFFYANYEAFRRRQQTSATPTLLTATARNGDFVYRDSAGNVQTVNVLRLRNATIDPFIRDLVSRIPDPSAANSFDVGDSRPGFLRNTIGYAFPARSNRDRNNFLARTDYVHSTRHSFSGSYAYTTDVIDRPDAGVEFNSVPAVRNDNHAHLVSGSWRWMPSASIVNEVRGGFNLAPGDFLNQTPRPDLFVAGTLFTYPINNFLDQGRATDTYNISETASWLRGKHNLQFGFQQQTVRVNTYDNFGVVPAFGLGMGAGQPALTARDLPGIGAQDLAAANGLLATLGGFLDSYTQTFNVTSRSSGFIPGAENRRRLRLGNYSFFVQDQWKPLRRLSVNVGLRWEYQTPMRERDSLFLLPRLIGGNYIATILSNATLDFAGNKDTRDLYKRDFNNLGPNIGLAWDVFGDGRTALRAGYSIYFVNDQVMTALFSSASTNDGLQADVSRSGLTSRISAGRPSIPTPKLQVPRTFQDNFDLAPDSNAAAMPDPGLVTPYVQQWTFGIQREIRGAIVEARYLGNQSTKQLRALDFNQVNIRAGGFLDDFVRARNNGFLARAATGVFDPRPNTTVAGSQPLPVFDSIQLRGLLTNGTIAGLIERGEVGQLAHLYVQAGFEIPFRFYNSPFIYGGNVMTNYSNTSYHSLQLDVRRRMRNGLSFQTNYTWSKALSDSLGDGQFLFEPFLDFANARIEKAPAAFDLRHTGRRIMFMSCRWAGATASAPRHSSGFLGAGASAA
jgi:hypothetical protein